MQPRATSHPVHQQLHEQWATPLRKILTKFVLTTFLLLPVVTQAEQWEPDVFADSSPVSVIVRHYSDAVEVTGPTGLRAIVLTINGQGRFKGDKAKITVQTTTPNGSNVSQVYLFAVIGSGPLNVSFRIGDSDAQYDVLFAQLKNATSIHAAVNNTDMRFDADGLGADFDVYMHQS